MTPKQLEKQRDLMLDSIDVTADIRCTKCGESDSIRCSDDWDAVNAFIENGWYATADNVYCILCNDKRLEKSKKK